LKDFLTPTDAARLAHVSSQTIRRWCEQGLFFRAARVGGRWRINRESFNAYLKSCQVMAGASLEDFERKHQQAVSEPKQVKNWNLLDQ